jgi:GT2 family glycosyltransferase
MEPWVYIVIVNYKKWQDAKDCLETVLRSTYNRYTVFVIDNNSQNNSLEYLISWVKNTSNSSSSCLLPNEFKQSIPYNYFLDKDLPRTIDPIALSKLNFVQNTENRGFAAGNNLVLQHICEQDAYVWLLNPDMVIEENTLFELVNFANERPFKSVIGSVVKFFSDKNRVHLYGGAQINFNLATVNLITEKEAVSKIDFICGGSMFVHARHFKELGLLPENYFLYWEETEWCYKAKKEGYKMLVCPNAICYDKISTTIGKSFLADYYYTRNGLLFVSQFKKSKVPIAVFSAFLRLLKRSFQGQWHRSRGVYQGILTFLNR